eukprot:CAMPEP_0183340116 /NCGR_PEP_ID=MMETSP0164_2-20130417/6778_1 /TAXON_ID=221442 /ORGANISM="Coccolithus pelagicus ssp braarudi, Strain PLY182g" /LENGTH=95 /DNA_ID=CAMNT_0025510201 /DNA_START=369 /DNA_END=654 /DNA_ORIENTATION=-
MTPSRCKYIDALFLGTRKKNGSLRSTVSKKVDGSATSASCKTTTCRLLAFLWLRNEPPPFEGGAAAAPLDEEAPAPAPAPRLRLMSLWWCDLTWW